MHKLFIFLISMLLASSGFSSWISQTEKARASRMRSYGGDVIDRRGQKGSFFVVNAQKSVDAATLLTAINEITDRIRIDAILTNGVFSLESSVRPGDATLYIVEQESYPMSLVAVESKWALVNVAKLRSDKPAFFNARVMKEIRRTIAQLFGAFSNQYDSNIFSGVFSAEDLDQIVSVTMPMEYRLRFDRYLPSMGFSPYKLVHYKKAVQEGWAPQPTNEYQKAIWEKVHALPTAPIKIKPETKKVAE